MILNIARYGWRCWDMCFFEPPPRNRRLGGIDRLLEMVFLEKVQSADELTSWGRWFVDIT